MSRPLRAVRPDIQAAVSRSCIALKTLDLTYERLDAQLPGYPAGGDNNGGGKQGQTTSQPERLSRTLRNDEAVKALDVLDRQAKQLLKSATELYDIATRWGQPGAGKLDDPGELWCRSCFRNDQHCEPSDTTGRYKTLCRWCGEFQGAYKQLPPLTILAARHKGQRVTQQAIDVALAELKKHASKPHGKRHRR